MEITTIGLDLAKNVFQVHAINSASNVVVKRTLRRSQMRRFFEQLDPCLVGIEACGTSHYWAREITRLGHEVRLMPPAYVKPYVKRGKDGGRRGAVQCPAIAACPAIRPEQSFEPGTDLCCVCEDGVFESGYWATGACRGLYKNSNFSKLVSPGECQFNTPRTDITPGAQTG